MNVEQFRESFQKTAYKLELPTDHFIFSSILACHHFQNKLNVLSSRHRHITYEVRCLWYPDDRAHGVFEIIPPGVWHTGYFEKGLVGAYLSMFQFDVRPRTVSEDLGFPNAALDAFALLRETVEIPDDFGGVRMIQRLHELLEQNNGSYEQIYLQFQQLMLALAKSLPCAVPEEQKHGKFLLSDFYPQVIEEFMALRYTDPGCSREQLAALLCVSERQLIRIMEQLYKQTFRELLTEFRMEAAERWRVHRKLSVEENAKAVGFLTVKGFLKAYEQYHKKSYEEQT